MVVTLSALLIGHLTLMVTCGYVIPPVHETDPPPWGARMAASADRHEVFLRAVQKFEAENLPLDPLANWCGGTCAGPGRAAQGSTARV